MDFNRLDLDRSDATASASAVPHVGFMRLSPSRTFERCAPERLPTNEAVAVLPPG